MIRLIPTYAVLFMFAFLLSCSQDNSNDSVDNLITADARLLKTEQPSRTNDLSKNGLYHGVVASSSSLSRGKIWINISNYNGYNALIELADGSELTFQLAPSVEAIASTTTIYEFIGSAGSFIFDITDISTPQITELFLNSESYFSQVVKSLSYNMASTATAIFSETGNPTFTGTWSVIADGSNPNPNGNNGDGITSLMIVYDGQVYEDFVFDAFNATSCFGNNNYVPTLNSFGTLGFTISDYQTTEFGGGVAKWNLSYDPSGASYMNYFLCQTAASGTFSWTSDDNLTIRDGDIMLD